MTRPYRFLVSRTPDVLCQLLTRVLGVLLVRIRFDLPRSFALGSSLLVSGLVRLSLPRRYAFWASLGAKKGARS